MTRQRPPESESNNGCAWQAAGAVVLFGIAWYLYWAFVIMPR